MALLEKGNNKLLNAWAFYDWANSVYTLTIASAIFPIFYAQLFLESKTIDVLGFTVKNTALISFVTAFTFVVITLSSPILSGIADYIRNKRVFMKFFCYMGSLGCIGLYWFSLENIYLSLFLYFLGLWGYWGSLVFYNSYLPDIAYPEQQDSVSAKGFSIGYVGSVILLLLNLAMVMKPNWFGITGTESEAAMKAMRYSFITVGLWWILFSQYTFYHLPKGYKREGGRTNIVLNGFRELKSVWKQLGGETRLKRYLGAFFVYSMAVQTIMLIATYFGEEEIAWGTDTERTTGLIISILVIQIVAIAGATVTAYASKLYGNVRTLVVINIIWILLCVYAYFLQTPMDFYIAAGLVGVVMGGIQALSRSTYSKFLPETTDTKSFFSFYDVAEKIGIVIGTFLYGAVAQLTGSMRNSTIFLGLFFLIGVFLLLRVNKGKERQ